MKVVMNEMASLGYELKQSILINERSKLHCLDIYKDGEYVCYITPSLEKTINTKNGHVWQIREIFMEFYGLTDVEFIEKRITCTLDEYYVIKKELQDLGVVRTNLEGSDSKADVAIKESGESLSASVAVAKIGKCWVAREFRNDCLDNYLYFLEKPDLKLFYKVLEMARKID